MSSRNGSDKPETQKEERRGTFTQKPSRAVIISALAAGGVFQLNGWQVQAHGNRSSHTVASVSSVVLTPDGYTLKQDEGTQEGATKASRQLAIVKEQLRKANRLAADSPEVRELVATKASLERQVRAASASRQTQQFLKQGDIDAVIAVVEGQGTAHKVLADYTWALVDAAYLGDDNQLSATEMKNLVTLSKAAMAYSEKALQAAPEDRLVQEHAAEIYHNVASFTLPEDGAAAAAQDLRVGREAAERALALRQELGQKQETMIAHLTVGKHYLQAGQTEKARNAFENALRLSTELNDLSGIAWSKTNLAKATSDVKKAQALRADAGRIAQKAAAQDASLQALRVEQRLQERGK